MNGDEFIEEVNNIFKARSSKPPTFLLVRIDVAEAIKNEQRVKDFVTTSSSGKYSIRGVPIELATYMLDPVYGVWK